MTKLDDTKLPWLPLVVADYQRDTRHLSLSARGAWTDILCAMHVSQTRGVVRFNRVKLARFLGATVDQAEAILAELRDPDNATGRPVADVNEVADGHFEIVSRRMVRDEQRRETNRANGSRGGNPKLKASRLTESVNRLPNPPVNPGDNPKSQSQSQTGEVSPDPSGVAKESREAEGGSKPAKTRKRPPADPLPEIPEPIDTPEFRRAWELFVESRRRSRYPLTSAAAVLNLSTCVGIFERMGIAAAVDACKTAVAFSWRGIVVPRGPFNGNYQNGNRNQRAATGARVTECPEPDNVLEQYEQRGRPAAASPRPERSGGGGEAPHGPEAGHGEQRRAAI